MEELNHLSLRTSHIVADGFLPKQKLRGLGSLGKRGQGEQSLKASGLLRANDFINTALLEVADGWPAWIRNLG